jgi:small GTP-binding protein
MDSIQPRRLREDEVPNVMSSFQRRQFKICLIGDGYVGKTSARRKFLDKIFKTNYIPTLGVDFARKTLTYKGIHTDLVIWDIAGQPLFQNLRKRYYDGASGIVLVYSVIDRETFDNASKWLVEAKEFMGKLPPLIVLGNKIDLRSSQPPGQVVSSQEGESFAKKFGNSLNTPTIFMESSAMTGENIDKAFTTLTAMMIGDEVHQEPIVKAMETVVQATPMDARPAAAVEPTHSEVTQQSMSQPLQSNPTSIAMTTDASEPTRADMDPDTALFTDSAYLKEDQIGEAMKELVQLRAELKAAEEDLANTISGMETSLLTLRNVIHVKKIMYEHLQGQLRQTRQEWAEAYDEYVKAEQDKKEELAKRSKQIDGIRTRIELVGKRVRERVGDLEMKRMSG